MKYCPICRSTRLRRIHKLSKDFRCDRCGYEHQENPRVKEVFSKTGEKKENSIYRR